MGNDDRVLTQAEIDALLSSSAVSAPAPKAPAAPVQQVKVSAAPPPPKVEAQQPKAAPPPPVKTAVPERPAEPSPAPKVVNQGPTPEQVANLCRQIIAEQTRDLSKQILELTIKAKEIEKINQRIADLENKISEISEITKTSPKAFRAMGSRIDEIYGMLENMRREKNESDEERIRDQFRCVNCKSEKLVAIHVKCTNCGMENWMGWFPDSKVNKEKHF